MVMTPSTSWVLTKVRGDAACIRDGRGGRILGSARGVLHAPEEWHTPPASSAAYLRSRPPSDPADRSTTTDIVQFATRRELSENKHSFSV